MARLPLVLASRSPQRTAILTQLGLAHVVVEPDYDEPDLRVAPRDLVATHAREKARSITPALGTGPVLGVDTAVLLDDGVTLLGKPASESDAHLMLAALAGRTHVVISGLALIAGERSIEGVAETAVTFRELDEPSRLAYVAAGEWRGRAGGYAIQGLGAALVERVDGCYGNVVGLPIALLIRSLRDLGYEPW